MQRLSTMEYTIHSCCGIHGCSRCCVCLTLTLTKHNFSNVIYERGQRKPLCVIGTQ